MTRRSLDGLTIIRFLAAFYVFIFHLQLRIPLPVPNYAHKFLMNGAIGMSIFFVLSGFVLSYNYEKRIPESYYTKRFLRIYPAYLLMGLLTIPFIFKLPISTILISMLIFILPVQAWFYQSFPIWNFGGSWSISVECFFYALFPLILKILGDDRRIKMVTLVTAYLISAFIVPAAYILDKGSNMMIFYSSPLYRLPEFLIGIILASSTIREALKIKRSLFLPSVLIYIMVAILPNPGYMFWHFISLPCLSVIILYAAQAEVKKTAISKLMIWGGRISYSFYLMQLPLLMFLDKIVDIPFYGSIITQYRGITWTAMLTTNIGLSYFSFALVENNEMLRRWLAKNIYTITQKINSTLLRDLSKGK